MKLKGLRLHGFKSFADSTQIDFHEGITAVVGPNGCGKSNISDAIRWVLGEQRPTAIRGAKMEEAIFQGSVNRRPVSRGSVSLLVANEDGVLPVPFEEVELGRTVYRDGGSDYSINRSSCRLKDVVDLCRDTGLGANAYAIIENRMVDAILSDRAEERRGLFEEASGVGKYKDRRKAALRRLERAELDLQRLDDVIGEVESKVRSLARQKGKAQRFATLRDRRLAVEVSVARHQLDTMNARLVQVQRELAGDRELGEGYLAELRAAEAQLETLRLRQVEAEKARSEAAGRLGEIREALVRWERELAVADERASYARRRLDQIAIEQAELRESLAAAEEKARALGERETGLESELADLLVERDRRASEAAGAREALESARSAALAVEGDLRELSRRQVRLEGEASSGEAQAAELARHLERLQAEMASAAEALSEVESQGDLFSDRLSVTKADMEDATAALEEAKRLSQHARERLQEARRQETVATEAVSGLEARIEALEGMDRSHEGLEPAVRAALELGDPGVFGTLGDSLAGDPDLVRAVESFLGPLVQGIVVEDAATVGRLRAWYSGPWKGRGGLILFPLDSAPASGEPTGSLLNSLVLDGPGRAWAQSLLDGIDLEPGAEPIPRSMGRGTLSLSGAAVDRKGVVRFGNPLGSSGVVERRERVKLLREQLNEALDLAESARIGREQAELDAQNADLAREEAWGEVRTRDDAHRSASAQAQAQGEKRERLDRHQDELARQIEGTKAARARALERAEGARADGELLVEEMEALRLEEEGARAKVEAAQSRWEEARGREAELSVEVARLTGDRDRVRERGKEIQASLEQSRRRMEVLEAEKDTLRKEELSALEVREEGTGALETLFGQRDEAEKELEGKKEAGERASETLSEADRRVRQLRAAERDALDRRHAQELEQQELTGRIGRIQDRLEGEWGRPFAVLLAEAEPLEGDPDELREELQDIVVKLDRIGPVNMLAVEEHQEESARLEFLMAQRGDLKEARDDLRAAIRQINETATRLFQDTFGEIRKNFRATFERLFEGGEADLWLEDENEPLESAIEIHASPKGKKTQRIDLLSGGERSLTALSLLFGIYLVKPSPFCVLDEVDAPLDESNIYRFIKLLQEFKADTQFIVITHNARTIEAADWIYGVTMEEPGVSRIVGVRLEDALQVSGSAA